MNEQGPAVQEQPEPDSQQTLSERRVLVSCHNLSPEAAYRSVAAVADLMASAAGANIDEMDLLDLAIAELCDAADTSIASFEFTVVGQELFLSIPGLQNPSRFDSDPIVATAFPTIDCQEQAVIFSCRFIEPPHGHEPAG